MKKVWRQVGHLLNKFLFQRISNFFFSKNIKRIFISVLNGSMPFGRMTFGRQIFGRLSKTRSMTVISQWKIIHHKQSAKWQHLSRLKASAFLFEFFFVRCDQISFGQMSAPKTVDKMYVLQMPVGQMSLGHMSATQTPVSQVFVNPILLYNCQ